MRIMPESVNGSPTEEDWKLVGSVDESPLLKIAFNYTKNEDIAWQVLQEARRRAAMAMRTFQKRDDPRAIHSYLITATRRVAFEWLRRENNGPVVFSSEVVDGVAAGAADDVSDRTYSEA